VFDVLQTLRKAGKKLVLASNCLSGAAARAQLQHDGLLELFDATLFSNEVGYRKPGRQLLDAALAAVQVSARDACFVGDRIDRDVFAGRRAGLGLCVLREAPSGPGRPIQGIEPDYTVKDLAELLLLPGIGCGPAPESASSRTQWPGNVTTSATT
jgi:FMN phosphatase YigB (HAD superfamily)